MLIGKLTERTGISKDTIRFYEKKGLIEGNIVTRRENRYKEYSEDVLDQLILIKLLRRLSFTLEEIKTMTVNTPNFKMNCFSLADTVNKKLNRIETELKNLNMIKSKLISVKKECDGDCSFEKKIPSCLNC
ncbi:MerR family transcriptional regulator [Leptospira sp. FAT2]|uniref:MerR family transcriptional regulator n=1 Tax=Leptospira sanjuanensis TaxID=2879643 RepID=UPI001EE991C7|nr:MerR family transcriptional regulator [Leptospira sanjuanensis]MCG6192358.1 MerR family transcriptional regulator [Leptospira sanjuanensis]